MIIINRLKYNVHPTFLKSILLLSDTHSYIDERILDYAAKADQVWHAGDIGDLTVTDQLSQVADLTAVYGNIDDAEARVSFPLDAHFTCEGLAVYMTHIGGYPGRYDRRIRDAIRLNPPGLFISGHSHILKVMPDKKLGLLHMNPGAIGKHGFHQVRTMLRFKVHAGKVQDLEVIEIPR